MKLKNILEDLKEEFVSGIEVGGDYIEIFKNSRDRKEIRDALGVYDRLRFITDKTEENVYIWDASIMHIKVARKVNEVPRDYYNELFGEGEFIDGYIEIVEIDKDISPDIIKDFVFGKYDWLKDYYFKIEDIKDQLEMYI